MEPVRVAPVAGLPDRKVPHSIGDSDSPPHEGSCADEHRRPFCDTQCRKCGQVDDANDEIAGEDAISDVHLSDLQGGAVTTGRCGRQLDANRCGRQAIHSSATRTGVEDGHDRRVADGDLKTYVGSLDQLKGDDNSPLADRAAIQAHSGAVEHDGLILQIQQNVKPRKNVKTEDAIERHVITLNVGQIHRGELDRSQGDPTERERLDIDETQSGYLMCSLYSFLGCSLHEPEVADTALMEDGSASTGVDRKRHRIAAVHNHVDENMASAAGGEPDLDGFFRPRF